MGIKYFYNFCISSLDSTDLSGDILSAVRKSYFNDFDKIRDKITVDSEKDCLLYDYCIEKDKPLKWTVRSADGTILQDVAPAEGGRYYICFYEDQKLKKRLLFSRLHTLLRAEYTEESGVVCSSIEPRKFREGLCLLYKSKEMSDPVILSEITLPDDERLRAAVDEEFDDYTAVASTNEGVIRYLSAEQIFSYNTFLTLKQSEFDREEEESFLGEGDEAPLYDRINAKDFNVKRNLSASLDITEAEEFGATADDDDQETDDKAVEPAEETLEEAVEATVEGTIEAESSDSDAEADSEPVSVDSDVSIDVREETQAKPDKLIMADGSVYCYYGELDENGNRSGYGRTVTDLGRTAYEGTYLGDKRSGKGAYFYKDGTLCYSGEWSENVRHGVGVGISARDGSMHIGRWKNNRPEGNGARLSARGDIKFVCKELPDGCTVLMNYTEDNSVMISKYDPEGKKISEKTVSLTDF